MTAARQPKIGRPRAQDIAAKDRKVLIDAGHNPRVSEVTRRYFWELMSKPEPGSRSGHMPVTRAARIAGLSRATGERWWSDPEQRRRYFHEARLRLAPPPIALQDLTERALALLLDFGAFRWEVLGHYNTPWASISADQLIRAYFDPEQAFIVFNLAPGMGKTTVASHDFVVWMTTLLRALGEEPRIFLGHKTEEKSKQYVRRIANTMTRNSELLALYGRMKPETTGPGTPWSTEQLLIEPLQWDRQTQKEATITRGSYKGGVLSGRYEVMICDDWIDLETQETEQQREKVLERWNQEIDSRLEPHGMLVLSNARVSPEDLSWSLLQDLDPDEVDDAGEAQHIYRKIAFAAHYDDLCDGVEHSGPTQFDAAGLPIAGCLLDPSRVSWKKLRREESKNPNRLRLVYQQEDVDPVGSLAQKVWFTGGTDTTGFLTPGCFEPEHFFGQVPDLGPPTFSALSVDPSAMKWWGLWHLLYYAERDLWWCFRGARRMLKLPELLYSENGRYTGLLEDWWALGQQAGVAPNYLVFEARGIQTWFGQLPYTQEWATSRGVSIYPHDTNRVNKKDPDFGVQMEGPIIRRGGIRLPYAGHEERLFADQFQREACSWPNGSTSDLVMGFWFTTNRRQHLVVNAVASQARQEPVNVPAWVQQFSTETPEWVKEMAVA